MSGGECPGCLQPTEVIYMVAHSASCDAAVAPLRRTRKTPWQGKIPHQNLHPQKALEANDAGFSSRVGTCTHLCSSVPYSPITCQNTLDCRRPGYMKSRT